jgi:hypothetical protein
MQNVECAWIDVTGEMICLEKVPLEVLRNVACILEASAAHPEMNIVAPRVHILLLSIVYHEECGRGSLRCTCEMPNGMFTWLIPEVHVSSSRAQVLPIMLVVHII